MAYLQKMGAALQDWNSAHAYDAIVRNAASKMNAVCGKLPEAATERQVCTGLIREPSTPGAAAPKAGERN